MYVRRRPASQRSHAHLREEDLLLDRVADRSGSVTSLDIACVTQTDDSSGYDHKISQQDAECTIATGVIS